MTKSLNELHNALSAATKRMNQVRARYIDADGDPSESLLWEMGIAKQALAVAERELQRASPEPR